VFSYFLNATSFWSEEVSCEEVLAALQQYKVERSRTEKIHVFCFFFLGGRKENVIQDKPVSR